MRLSPRQLRRDRRGNRRRGDRITCRVSVGRSISEKEGEKKRGTVDYLSERALSARCKQTTREGGGAFVDSSWRGPAKGRGTFGGTEGVPETPFGTESTQGQESSRKRKNGDSKLA